MLVVADDATGALEAGGILAGLGHPANVELDAGALVPPEGVRVVLLPTRHDDAAAARARVNDAFARFGLHPGADGARLYWKTDSTLRGPIGNCFAALRGLFPERPLVYVPAYPAMGRTVREGVLHVDGVPVAETAFARDPRWPVRESRVAMVAGHAMGLRVALIRDDAALSAWLRAWRSGTTDVAVCDAETDADVAALFAACRDAERVLGCKAMAAGPAGGIRMWTGGGGVPWAAASTLGAVQRWLVLCGSRHPVSRVQAEAARAMGLPVLAMPEETQADADRALRRVAEAAAATGADGMLIFGGDTALALWRRLGLRAVQALGEVLPGVPVSRGVPASRGAGIVFVTKAGGFGAPDLVAKILAMAAGVGGDA
jgi:uncharacterized protein YgbK (DUF1537 family)